ncbi:hypothetical protein BC936DRAFT_143201 [Jimgerdemannia flammicorona]|uniref:Uncharacterized protein n=1 Tax=Jimgerdemannia flammicorona TaxID=994334 RepID=A0A433DMH1_9FUNG|nr:hypothetical protein BC936DRAFT_143201 [Jimgerdemannia flammicorona]
MATNNEPDIQPGLTYDLTEIQEEIYTDTQTTHGSQSPDPEKIVFEVSSSSDDDYREELNFIYAPFDEVEFQRKGRQRRHLSSEFEDFSPEPESRNRETPPKKYKTKHGSESPKCARAKIRGQGRAFTKAEDERLWEAVLKHGKKWTAVAAEVGNGREREACRSRMTTLKKHAMKGAGW